MVERQLSDKQILVIDDEDTIRFLLKEMLMTLGYEATEASSKEDAVLKLNAIDFDLIFVDIFYTNADYNGFDIIDIIKEAQPNCKVVILTAKPSMNTAVKALRCRILDYLEKPICLDVLTSITELAFKTDHISAEKDIHEKASGDITLTKRESEILELLAKGFSYAEAGQYLDCKISTVQWHVKNIYRKLDVTSKSEAVYEALCMKLIDIK